MAQLGSSKIFGDLVVLGETKVDEDIYEGGKKLSDKYVGKAQVLTDVPANAKFTDTIATKTSLGLNNVDNIQQSSKVEFDNLVRVVDDKVDKVTGKDLSSNDFTDFLRSKLINVEEGATNYKHPSSHPYSMITGTPTSLPANGGNANTVGNASPSMVNSNNTIVQRNASGEIHASKVHGAVYNDYAEYRNTNSALSPGTVVVECGDGFVQKSLRRRSKVPMVVSDTFGMVIGDHSKGVPIAVAGRVLVKVDKEIDQFKIGDVLCTGREGKATKMKWWERILFPERILGLVSEIPSYKFWGSDDVDVGNRLWIKI